MGLSKSPLSTRLILSLLLAAGTGCIQSIDAPGCLTLADCPADEGYNSCEDGYCFKAGKCAQAGFKPDDACCPPVEGDRSGDNDCLVLAEYIGNQVTIPTFDAKGNLYITFTHLDETFGTMVKLERLTPEDLQAMPVQHAVPIVVGKGEAPLPAMVTRNATVYASYDGGVNRYTAETLELQTGIESPRPQGGLAFTANGPRSIVAWPAAGGQVVIYDEDGDTTVNHDLPALLKAPEMAQSRFLAPVLSGNGRRLYVVNDGGHLVALEVGINPLGPVASTVLPALPAGPPVESGGRIFLCTVDDRMLAYRENSEFGFDLKWELDLGSTCAGRPLLDGFGDLVVALLDGRAKVIRDFDSEGSLVGEGHFGQGLAAVTPMLTDRYRVVALGAGGDRVLSLLRTDEAGSIGFSEGLSFDLEFPTTASPSLADSRLFLPLTSSLRLLAWTLPEELPASGYPREGGYAENTNQVVLSLK